jgi:hypothetical protein
MKTLTTVFISIILFTYIACDRPNCKNTNPIFDKFSPESSEYKLELSKQIQSVGFENLDYWFDKYLKINDKEYIEINVQNDSLCAKATVEVKNWSKIEGLRKEINGYRGAKLNGLRMRIERVGNKVDFIYEDIANIED